MLTNITIRNLAIIDEISVDFEPGFNVLSGETGAGKSIIINALGLLLGDRASADLIKSGAEEARVEALFALEADSEARAVLERLGLPPGDELLLSRRIHASGRSQCRLNGLPVTLAMMREVGRALVDIHGQHEHQSLLRVETHLAHLDAAGGQQHLAEVARFGGLYAERSRLAAEWQALRRDDRARAHRVDLLQFQVREIEAAELTAGEEEALLDERRRLSSVEKLGEAAAEAVAWLAGGEENPGAAEAVARAEKVLETITSLDSSLAPVREGLETASVHVQESLSALRNYVDSLEADPARLDAVEARLHQLSQLKRKYGESVEAVMAYGRQARTELDSLTHSETRLQELAERLTRVEQEVAAAGKQLSERRRKLAAAFERAVSRQLNDLNMEHARFHVELTWEPDPRGVPVDGERVRCTSTGFDRVRFLLAPNPGEPPKPLARIASGGEMSRVMLALKSASRRASHISTWIFDEVDAGIGGATAEVVGRKLASLARRRQALCVTHLAQIAAQAEWHQVVRKSAKRGTTRVEVVPLSPAERVEEIARMLGGESLTETTRRHAAELLFQFREAAA